MATRFRKTFKLGKFININLNKNSIGLSVGGKLGRYTVNSNGRRTTTVHTPISGLSFVDTKTASSKGNGSRQSSTTNAAPSGEAFTKPKKIKEPKPLKTGVGMLIITVLFGWLGVQRYASGQIGLGLLYTFTAGVFCIGWFYDIYLELKAVIEASRALDF